MISDNAVIKHKLSNWNSYYYY